MKSNFSVKPCICIIGCLLFNLVAPFVPGSPALAAPAAQADPGQPGPEPTVLPPLDPNAPLAPADTPVRRVNAPFSADRVRLIDSAIFWFGRVTATENYADVRVGYTPTELVIRVNIFDRLLWHDISPSTAELTQYDAVSLYLSLDGNTGAAPDGHDYRFVAMSTTPNDAPQAQAAYRGSGAAWTPAVVTFAAPNGWRGDARNNLNPDRGWSQEFSIPFTSLGLSGAPATGAVWGLGVVVHDRDDAAGTPIPDKFWPETLNTSQPGTWGQLAFGLPSYQPPAAAPAGAVTIREGLNGAVVPDAAVGGTVDNLCSGNQNYIWSGWGNANFGSAPRFNLQNQGDVADWPCFAKYYINFPLNQIPAGKAILSATLTLHQWGGSDPTQAERSLIQILSVAEDWSESSLAWNNAPLALENVSQAWVDVVDRCNWPCVPRTWDVSRAVAQAYQTGGGVVKLALYEADSAYHSGKYFIGSEEPAWNAVARPTLTIVWGERAAQLSMSAAPPAPKTGDLVQVRFQFTGAGETLSLTNPLPNGLGTPTELNASHGTLQYNAATRTILWSGAAPAGAVVSLSYVVPVVAQGRQTLHPTATLTGPSGASQAGVTLAVNGETLYLPLLTR